MRISDRFKKLLEGMPNEASVTLPVTTLREWLDDSGPGGFEPDLTVKEVADYFGRGANTVTAWIRAGDLRAYKLHGREYRVTRAAVEEFQRKQSQGQ